MQASRATNFSVIVLLCTPFGDAIKSGPTETPLKPLLEKERYVNKDEVTFVIIGLESGFLGETDQRRCVNNALLGSTFQIFLVEGQASFIIIEPGPFAACISVRRTRVPW
jgi:hypothetical protein